MKLKPVVKTAYLWYQPADKRVRNMQHWFPSLTIGRDNDAKNRISESYQYCKKLSRTTPQDIAVAPNTVTQKTASEIIRLLERAKSRQ